MTPLSGASSSSQCYAVSDDETVVTGEDDFGDFYKANILWDEVLNEYRPHYPLYLQPIEEIIKRDAGELVIPRVSKNLFFGTETIPKVAALAYAVLDFAIDLGFQPAEKLMRHHQRMGFGFRKGFDLVKITPARYLENYAYSRNGHLMYQAFNSKMEDFLNAAANVLAIDRRIVDLQLTLSTRQITPNESHPLMRVIKTIQSSPYLKRLSITKVSILGHVEKNSFLNQLAMIVGINNKIEHLTFFVEGVTQNNIFSFFLYCVEGLSTNTTLKFLKIQNSTFISISSPSQDYKIVEPMIINSLYQNLTLTSLILSYLPRFPNQLFQSFSKGLCHNKTLETINFEDTDLSLVESCSYFARALLVHPSLSTIRFRSTQLRFPEPIILALSKNTSVTDLNMSLIKASDSAGRALAKILPHNTTLVCLVINGNRFSDKTVTEIAEALARNRTLEILEFTRQTGLTDSSEEFYEHVIEFAGLNGSLTHWNWDANLNPEVLLRNSHNKNTRNTRMLTTLLKDIEDISREGELRRGPTRRTSVTE